MKLFGRSSSTDGGELRRVTGHPGDPVEGRPVHPEVAEAQGGSTPVQGRLARLQNVVDKTRRGRSDRNVRKILQVLGMAAIAMGFVCVILGWYGASHSPYLYQEVPYLISGGLLGVALVLGGGILISSAWSLRKIEEDRRNALAIVRSVDRLERILRPPALDNGRDDAHQEVSR
jgi:hypothetical protein